MEKELDKIFSECAGYYDTEDILFKLNFYLLNLPEKDNIKKTKDNKQLIFTLAKRKLKKLNNIKNEFFRENKEIPKKQNIRDIMHQIYVLNEIYKKYIH